MIGVCGEIRRETRNQAETIENATTQIDAIRVEAAASLLRPIPNNPKINPQ